MDGVLDTMVVIDNNLGTNSLRTSDLLNIAAGSGNGPQPFNGDIDEFEVFNRALSASEVQASLRRRKRGPVQTGTCYPAHVAARWSRRLGL